MVAGFIFIYKIYNIIEYIISTPAENSQAIYTTGHTHSAMIPAKIYPWIGEIVSSFPKTAKSTTCHTCLKYHLLRIADVVKQQQR